LSLGVLVGRSVVVICSPFYAEQDAGTSPGQYADLYDDLPRDPSQLREIVSHLIIHVSQAASYDVPPDTPMSRDTLPVADRLKLTQVLSSGSLMKMRAADKRSFGTCRDYALLLCSMCRHQSIPARVRCGFATYFTPDFTTIIGFVSIGQRRHGGLGLMRNSMRFIAIISPENSIALT
jgi:hypothetical protein